MKSGEEAEVQYLTNNCLKCYNRIMIMKMLESHPNLEVFIKSLIGQEADARRIFMHSATSVDLTANQG